MDDPRQALLATGANFGSLALSGGCPERSGPPLKVAPATRDPEINTSASASLNDRIIGRATVIIRQSEQLPGWGNPAG